MCVCVFMVNKEHFVMMWLFSIRPCQREWMGHADSTWTLPTAGVRTYWWKQLTKLPFPDLCGSDSVCYQIFSYSDCHAWFPWIPLLQIFVFLLMQTPFLRICIQVGWFQRLSLFWNHSEELCIQRRVSLPTDGKFSRWNRGNPALWGNSLWNLLLIR